MFGWRRDVTPECWEGQAITIPPAPSGLRALYPKSSLLENYDRINTCWCPKCVGRGAFNDVRHESEYSKYTSMLALRDFLGDQWSKWVWCGYFEITSQLNRQWVITDNGCSGNLFLKRDDGWRIYCCHPRHITCQEQCAHSQAMALLAHESNFVRTANPCGSTNMPARMEDATGTFTSRVRTFF